MNFLKKHQNIILYAVAALTVNAVVVFILLRLISKVGIGGGPTPN